LDAAIADFDKTSVGNPGTVDLIYSGNITNWKKAAWALKARFANHLSKRDPQGSAQAVLNATKNAFTGAADNFSFTKFTTSATGENPWFQESNDRGHHGISDTFYNLVTGLKDPRGDAAFFTAIGGKIVPAPQNQTLRQDQAGAVYSKASARVISATAHLPIITYDEIKFLEAEANLRLGNKDAAYKAYQDGIRAAMARVGVTDAKLISDYLAQSNIGMGLDKLTINDIITQKYLAFWIYQPIEAYNDFRRSGIPKLNNTYGPALRRFPYAQNEIDNNKANVPNVATDNGVWWDDGSED
jgi:hypothetical protein